MRSLSSSHLRYMLFAVFLTPCLSSTVQVDLLFPQNNAVYKPVHPFPIILDLYNFNKTWKQNPSISWYFEPVDGKDPSLTANDYPSMQSVVNTEDSPYPDQYTVAISTRELSIGKATTWRLKYFFRFHPDCALPDSIRLADCGNSTIHSCDTITFKIDNKTGITPSLASASRTSLLAFSVLQDENATDTKACPVFSRQTPRQSANTIIPTETQARISAELMNLTSCAGYSWPNTSIQTNCDAVVKKSGATTAISPFGFNTATLLGLSGILMWTL